MICISLESPQFADSNSGLKLPKSKKYVYQPKRQTAGIIWHIEGEMSYTSLESPQFADSNDGTEVVGGEQNVFHLPESTAQKIDCFSIRW